MIGQDGPDRVGGRVEDPTTEDPRRSSRTSHLCLSPSSLLLALAQQSTGRRDHGDESDGVFRVG